VLANQDASELVRKMLDEGFVKMDEDGVMRPGDAVQLS
jgi:hypothetical protein